SASSTSWAAADPPPDDYGTYSSSCAEYARRSTGPAGDPPVRGAEHLGRRRAAWTAARQRRGVGGSGHQLAGGAPEASRNRASRRRGAAWTEERGTSDEGRRCLKGGRRRAETQS